jgi:hypothetical protein
MSRTVSRPTNALATAYQFIEDDYRYDVWNDYLADIQSIAQQLWPSFYPVDKWLDNENHAILENQHATLGVSEYSGLVAIWLTPNYSEYYPQHDAIAEYWIAQVSPRFMRTFATLAHVATFSNGEAVYKEITHEN